MATKYLYRLELERLRFALGEAISMYMTEVALRGGEPDMKAITRWRRALDSVIENIGGESWPIRYEK